jgi:hypothetical protein
MTYFGGGDCVVIFFFLRFFGVAGIPDPASCAKAEPVTPPFG